MIIMVTMLEIIFITCSRMEFLFSSIFCFHHSDYHACIKDIHCKKSQFIRRNVTFSYSYLLWSIWRKPGRNPQLLGCIVGGDSEEDFIWNNRWTDMKDCVYVQIIRLCFCFLTNNILYLHTLPEITVYNVNDNTNTNNS